MNQSPIFIHSLFRAGSTYLFNTFRRSTGGYWCYQEPLHEIAVYARDNPELLLQDHGQEKTQQLRHPKLEQSYFYELYDTWPAWKDTLSESAIYNNYFAPPDEDIGISYWHSLAEAAKGRPVFQECRTSGRIEAIKRQLNGYHIYLWRNPWDQWWSYKAALYFDVANRLIINAHKPPLAVQALRSALNLENYLYDDLAEAFAYFWVKPLSAEESYLIFYMLWCLGLREGREQAHLLLNIDRLSDSPTYRDEMQKKMYEAGVNGVNFSDCHIPQGFYYNDDKAFFGPLEDKVHEWLRTGGWSQESVDQIQALRQQFQPLGWSKSVEDLPYAALAEQATRARNLARRFETSIAVSSHEAAAKIAGQEAKAEQAEAKAEQAEAKAEQAEAKAEQAEAKAEQAEAALHQTLTQLNAVYASTSWKITKPFRFVKRGLNERRAAANNAICSCSVLQKTLRQKVKVIVRKIGLYVLDKPVLKRKIVNYLNRHPALKQGVRSIVMGRQVYTVPASLESQACQLAPIDVNKSNLQSPSLVCIQGIGSAEKTPLEKNFNKYVDSA